jgi:hypothetical protein
MSIARAVAISVAVATWTAGSLPAALWPGGEAAAASWAYQYQYNFLMTAKGDGTFNGPIGNVSFSLSAKNDSGVPTGSCKVSEPKARISFKCLTVTDMVVFEVPGQPGILAANILGTGALNGTLMNYLIAPGDFGEPGVGNDSFFICASPGQTCYVNPAAAQFKRSGVLTSGNIQIHQ